ncbi:hypothetical protein ONZ51_g12463 [Trametes cubensis]|uniref:Uncharacterized protein n=1 Tax=Trametes cubensis TaxID=1111947 RepID=A0AAD7X5E3_9APHY|nr:hypothetical protein ONZ51_g12463 [Trametes cubensis]
MQCPAPAVVTLTPPMTDVIRDRTEQDVIPVLSTPLTLQYWVEGDQQVVEAADAADQTDPLEADETDIASEEL